MGSFNTSCSLLPDLNGTCEITGNQCTSYTSTNLGAAKTPIVNTGSGSNLAFKLEFEKTTTNPTPPPATIKTKYKYKVAASPTGNNYDGGADPDNEFSDANDPWVATAVGEPAVAAKA